MQHARFEQKDPLLIYKFESYELFRHMVQKMNQDVAAFCQVPAPQPATRSVVPRVLGPSSLPAADQQAGGANQRAAHGGGAQAAQGGQARPGGGAGACATAAASTYPTHSQREEIRPK